MKRSPTRGSIRESAGAFSEVTGGRPPSFSAEKTRPRASERKKRCQPFPRRFRMKEFWNDIHFFPSLLDYRGVSEYIFIFWYEGVTVFCERDFYCEFKRPINNA
jgi:hypothetical protein